MNWKRPGARADVRPSGRSVGRRRGRTTGAVLLVAWLGALILGCAVPADAAAATGVESGVAASVQAQLAASGVPVAAYAVIDPGGVTLGARGEGVSPRTPFVLGSISKSFTALAVLQLVDAGRIELQAPVQRYLPDFRTADPGDVITVEQLLIQTSGLPASAGLRIIDHPEESLAQRLQAVAGVRLESAPGAAFHYSNMHYAVLGRVVEQVSGQPFAGYVQQHLFDPLGMSDSYPSVDAARSHGLVAGSTVWFGATVTRSMPAYPGGSPDGFLVSTARDMATYLQFQLGDGTWQGNRVLSAASLARMHTAAVTTAPDVAAAHTDAYGMGWAIGRVNGHQLIAHDGDTIGYHATIALLPESRRALVVLTARNGALTGAGAAYDAGLPVLAGAPSESPSHAFWVTYAIVDVISVVLLVLLVVALVRRRWIGRISARISRYRPLRGAAVPVLRNLLFAGVLWAAVFYGLGSAVTGAPMSLPFAFGFVAPDLTLVVLLAVAYFLVRAIVTAAIGIRAHRRVQHQTVD